MASTSHARLTPYLRGVVFGMSLAGATVNEIMAEVCKTDGTKMSYNGVKDCIAMCHSNGGMRWDGDAFANANSGPPRKTSGADDSSICKLVVKNRGKVKVTIGFVRRKLPKLRRKVTARTIQRRLGEAGFAYLPRRKKSLVTAVHKVARLEWASWVLSRRAATLARWAFTDGTTFFLARDQTERQHSARGALGQIASLKTIH